MKIELSKKEVYTLRECIAEETVRIRKLKKKREDSCYLSSGFIEYHEQLEELLDIFYYYITKANK